MNRFGCRVCADADCPTAFGRFASAHITKHLLNVHASSATHLKCVAALGIEVPGRSAPAQAPSRTAFHRCLTATGAGEKLAAGPGLGERKKIARMTWCLAEGFRASSRKFLRSTQATSVMVDSTAEKLLVRFKSCNANLETRVGILGAQDLTQAPFSASANGVKNAFLHVLRQVATPLAHPPFSSKRGCVDEQFFQHLKESIYLHTADSTTPEQLAGMKLKEHGAAVLPNLRKVAQDKPHGVRRTPPQSSSAVQCRS